MAREHEVALSAVLAIPPRLDLSDGSDHAYVRQLDGLTYVCPWRLQLRAWDALDNFRSQLPDELRDAFFPPALSAAAEDARDVWRANNPELQGRDPHLDLAGAGLVVPRLRGEASGAWCSASAGPAPAAGLDRAMVYLTAMSRARRRVAKALRVVRGSSMMDRRPPRSRTSGRWLEDFHPHSLVELDYGGLVHLVDDEALSEDTSVADVNESLERLLAGDLPAAGQCYERVIARWRSVAALEHAN